MGGADARRQAEGHFLVALDLFAKGEHQLAIAEYEKSISTDPAFTDPLHGLVRIYQDLAEFDKAIALARRITQIDPDDVLAHTSLSILYQQKGSVAEAEAEGNKARILGWKQQLRAQKQAGR
jgi:tetratricopeptide (TPR) repeat protein